MASRVRRGVMAALSVAALAAVPMGVTAVVTPAVSLAGCQPGETGVIYGCAPFCVPGRQLDAATGLCLPVPPPAAAPAVGGRTPLW
ncbi:hypothetical protein M1247_15855 [Mycobacterium sp. 21AC1]|uniref:hypothetical protein n=1 Tax=[Mycobacterium] appelbergii TaxID=2939269 RepID=UPI00293910FB|nr:hypothetical protein [Mycobacterium sp. 21AC1]MDV3126396.1 hypothetical protein [Mycobacterium sp. 21AC1]